MKEKALFFLAPKRIDDLYPGNSGGRWMNFCIVKTIRLGKVDFENFITDLLADRQFIEDNISLCQKRGDCFLVTNRNHDRELLVIPWNGCFVRYAALRLPISILE